MLGISAKDKHTKTFQELFPQESVRRSVFSMRPMQKKRFHINGKEILLRLCNTEGVPGKNVLNYMVLEYAPKREQSRTFGHGYQAKYRFEDIIAESAGMQGVKKLAESNAGSDSAVLITGESGTGKELLAQAIHNASQRKNGPFIGINCAAFSESLLESELFGYEEGAFTGASRGGKKGIFEQANTGTLFLDEIGEIPIYLQAKLLRVLQEKEIMRIGGSCLIDVDVRIIAATNRNLKQMTMEGKFRADLYYRLKVIPVQVPPLRDRPEDLPSLVEFLQSQLKARFEFTSDAWARLRRYPWAGNVRELRNCVEYCRNLNQAAISAADLDPILEDDAPSKRASSAPDGQLGMNYLRESRFELRAILAVLKQIRQDGQKSGGCGRRQLAEGEFLIQEGVSENRLRAILQELEHYQMVCIRRGRKGTQLTLEGESFLEQFSK